MIIDDRIHRADPLCPFIEFIQIGDNRLLIRNRDIQRRKFFRFHQSVQLLRTDFNQLVGITTQSFVNPLGIAVT